MTEPAASRIAALTKFSDAMSSRPSACRCTSFVMAAAISGSASASGRDTMDGATSGIDERLYWFGLRRGKVGVREGVADVQHRVVRLSGRGVGQAVAEIERGFVATAAEAQKRIGSRAPFTV